jgi:formate hydrogenlyase transcriptional activator
MEAITEKSRQSNSLQSETADWNFASEAAVPHAHLAYFWETDKEFAAAIRFLETGLRGSDHCVIFGHEEANHAVCKILRQRGFEVETLQAAQRLTILGGSSSGEMILTTIAETFERAVANGAPLIRLLGNIGWFKQNWPDEDNLLAFEAKVTAAVQQFPCVVVCMYDLRSLPGHIVHHGGFETHPLIIRDGAVCQNPHHVPTEFFLEHLESVAAEIAERRRAEEALRKSEERFRTLFESAPIGISINNAEGKFLQVNRALENMLQYTEEELKTLSFKEVTLPEDLPESKQVFGELVAGQRQMFRIEKRYRRKNGDMVWANTVCSAVRDARGNFMYTFAMVEDITERKRAEQALRQAHEELSVRMQEQQKIDEQFRSITAGTASVTGAEFFHTLVRHLARAFQVRYAFVTECTDSSMRRVRTLAFVENDGFQERIEYDLDGTPCQAVIGGDICYYPEKLHEYFPKEEGLEGYLGLPFHDSAGRVLGHLAVLHDKPLEVGSHGFDILKIFAARAGAELQRQRAEAALQKTMKELEELKNRLQAENVYLQEQIKNEFNFEEVVGQSAAIKKVFQNVQKVAATDSTVLVTGETGTGKELAARAIHTLSRRKDRALITINCAALPSGLIESELFGHEKGAFTGATARQKGRFELADGGTLLLDEVGELPLETQAKLLRVLQEQAFERVGSAQTLRVNVRVIAATNRDLEEAVKRGSFRADLYYRLNIFPLHLPPLRERREDIPMLAEHFVGKFARRMGKRVERIVPEAMEMLVAYDWPGNVREMANLLERAVILCEGHELQKDHFAISPHPMKSEAGLATLEEAERAHILKALEKTNWVVGGASGAAHRLGLNRTTLIARMKKLGIEKAKA